MSEISTLDVASWWDEAACLGVDPDLFYPELGGNPEEAKAVCRRCPVRLQCLNHALDHHERHGIWGGYGMRERRRIARERALARR